jgi:hypothetical protein
VGLGYRPAPFLKKGLQVFLGALLAVEANGILNRIS